MPLTHSLKSNLLNHLFGGADYTPAARHYFALFTVTPNADGSGGTEVSGGSYARIGITNNVSLWPAASANSKSNGADVAFPTATADWGTVPYWGIYDSSSGGNLLAYGSLDVSATISNGDTATFAAGAMVVNFLSGGFGNTARAGLLNLAFGGTSYSRPSSVYIAAFTAPPSAGGGGTEVSGGSYARVTVPNNTTTFPASSGGSTKVNGLQFTFPTASASWGTITDMGIFDSGSGGNLLIFATLSTPRNITNASTLRFDATSITFSLN